MVRLVKFVHGIVNPDLEDLVGVLCVILRNTTIGEASMTSFLIRKFEHFPTCVAPLTVGREGIEILMALKSPVLMDDPILHILRLWCIFVESLELGTSLFPFHNPARLTNIVTHYQVPLFHT